MNFSDVKEAVCEFLKVGQGWVKKKQNYYQKTLIQQHKNESRSDEEYWKNCTE